MTIIIIVIVALVFLFLIFRRLRKSKQRVETVPPIPVYIVGDKKGKRGCSTPLLLFIILILGGVIIWLLMK